MIWFVLMFIAAAVLLVTEIWLRRTNIEKARRGDIEDIYAPVIRGEWPPPPKRKDDTK